MFVPAMAVNLLVFAWCRRRVEAQRARVAEVAKTTLSPEERAKLKAMIASRLRESVEGELSKNGPR